MMTTVTNGNVREGMTSRRGINGSYLLDPVTITHMLLGCVDGVRRLLARPHAFDDAAEIAVADDLAVLAEGDDGTVDRLDFHGRDLQAERVAAALHRVTARIAAAH